MFYILKRYEKEAGGMLSFNFMFSTCELGWENAVTSCWPMIGQLGQFLWVNRWWLCECKNEDVATPKSCTGEPRIHVSYTNTFGTETSNFIFLRVPRFFSSIARANYHLCRHPLEPQSNLLPRILILSSVRQVIRRFKTCCNDRGDWTWCVCKFLSVTMCSSRIVALHLVGSPVKQGGSLKPSLTSQ